MLAKKQKSRDASACVSTRVYDDVRVMSDSAAKKHRAALKRAIAVHGIQKAAKKPKEPVA